MATVSGYQGSTFSGYELYSRLSSAGVACVATSTAPIITPDVRSRGPHGSQNRSAARSAGHRRAPWTRDRSVAHVHPESIRDSLLAGHGDAALRRVHLRHRLHRS